MSFVTCGNHLLNLKYIKSIVVDPDKPDLVNVIVANTHQSAVTNSGGISYGNAYNMDMIWKCPARTFYAEGIKGAISPPTPDRLTAHSTEMKPVKYVSSSPYPPS
jgi:hypothetical protein